MLLEVREERLRDAMARAGFSRFEEIEREAIRRGKSLTARTIYNMIRGGNWTKGSVLLLCEILGCQPSDIMDTYIPKAEAPLAVASPTRLELIAA